MILLQGEKGHDCIQLILFISALILATVNQVRCAGFGQRYRRAKPMPEFLEGEEKWLQDTLGLRTQIPAPPIVSDNNLSTMQTASAPIEAGVSFPAGQKDNNIGNAARTGETIHHWPKGVIPFEFDVDIAQDIRERIISAMAEIEHDVANENGPCVSFIPRTDEIHYMRAFQGAGCHADIGFLRNGSQELSMSQNCAKKGVIKHELVHALGFFHEQCRKDRDDYIDINSTNLRDEDDFAVKYNNPVDALNTPYDLSSIMHYGPYTAAKDRRWPALTPKPAYASGLIMGRPEALSEIDVIRIQRMYGCPEDTSHITPPFSDRPILLRCSFDTDGCGLTHYPSGNQLERSLPTPRHAGIIEKQTNISFPDRLQTENNMDREDTRSRNVQAQWIISNGPITDGPVAGVSNGIDSFLYASKELIQTRNMQQNKCNDMRDEFENADDLDQFQIQTDYDYSDSNKTLLRVPRKQERKSGKACFQNEDNFQNITVTLLSPVMSSKDGEICLELEFVQTDLSSGLTLSLVKHGNQTVEMESYLGYRNNKWTWDGFTIGVGKRIPFQLEMRANLNKGGVAVDELIVTDGACI